MKKTRTIRFVLVAGCISLTVTCLAQAWVKPYEAGLKAATAAKWDEARVQFLQAIKQRGDETDKVRAIGGGVEPGGLPKVGIGTPTGLVPIIENKFALLIGNSQGGGLAFAENDVDILKEALIKHAGYADTNIVVVKNGSAETILQQAKSLA